MVICDCSSDGIRYSYAQIQVLEYLLENEDRDDNMSRIAARLGITRSNFTKIVNRLVSKGLLEKHYRKNSKKDMVVLVNERGRALYDAYTQEILRWHFSPMFREFASIPEEYYPHIAGALYNAMKDSTYLESTEKCAGP